MGLGIWRSGLICRCSILRSFSYDLFCCKWGRSRGAGTDHWVLNQHKCVQELVHAFTCTYEACFNNGAYLFWGSFRWGLWPLCPQISWPETRETFVAGYPLEIWHKHGKWPICLWPFLDDLPNQKGTNSPWQTVRLSERSFMWKLPFSPGRLPVKPFSDIFPICPPSFHSIFP